MNKTLFILIIFLYWDNLYANYNLIDRAIILHEQKEETYQIKFMRDGQFAENFKFLCMFDQLIEEPFGFYFNMIRHEKDNVSCPFYKYTYIKDENKFTVKSEKYSENIHTLKFSLIETKNTGNNCIIEILVLDYKFEYKKKSIISNILYNPRNEILQERMQAHIKSCK